MKIRLRIAEILVGSVLATTAASASVIYDYANWTSATLSTASAPGSAAGTLLAGSTTVNITYTGDVTSSTQVGAGGNNYYVPSTVYTNSQVANVPTNNTLIALSENPAYTDTLTFSAPLLNPILDIVSLGQLGDAVTYNFNATPVILSQGSAYFGGCSTCLSVSGNSLRGTEGSGVVEFLGSYSSLTWTTTSGEYWNGFTVGVQGLASVTPPTSGTPEPGTLGLAALAFAFPLVQMLRKRTR
jgi:hypothetical protein